MARIASFENLGTGTRIRSNTPVKCGYRILTEGNQTILHLETYGSDTRQERGKVSQSLQVDASAARELLKIIKRAFPGP